MKSIYKNSWLLGFFICIFYVNATAEEPVGYICEWKEVPGYRQYFKNGCPGGSIVTPIYRSDLERDNSTANTTRETTPEEAARSNQRVEEAKRIIEELYPHVRDFK